ncbi:MAG: T9SS type A sorting domain-containing protein, partial [Bacteroidia bacterium]
ALTISVFPQPALEQLNIQSSTSVTGLALFDIQGRAVRFWDEQGANIQLSIHAIPAGAYVLKGSSVKGPWRKKILIVD